MAVGWWGPAIRLSHGCFVHPGLRADGSLCTPDESRKGRRSNPSGNQGVCGAQRRLSSANFSHVLRERLKAQTQRYSNPITKATGGGVFMSHWGSGLCKGSSKCRFCQQNNSCQEHSSVLGVDGPAATTSTNHFNFGDCYDTTKSVTCTTTNHHCPTTRARDTTFITQRRYGRQNKLSGQHLVPKAPGGGSSFEVRTVLVVVAMVVGSCHAFPTLPPHSSPSSSRTPQIDQELPKKGMQIVLTFVVPEFNTISLGYIFTFTYQQKARLIFLVQGK